MEALSKIVGPQFTNEALLTALAQPGVGFIMASSHGLTDAILGYEAPNGPPVLCLQAKSYAAGAMSGIIFHLSACWTGVTCGPELVMKGGASAFIGYNNQFQLDVGYTPWAEAMLAPDAVVDYQLLSGATAGQAQTAATQKYTQIYEQLIADGDLDQAAMTKWNRDHFVGPNTDPIQYGDSAASIGNVPVHVRSQPPASATAFVGEIRMFAGKFAPAGWMFCEGELLPIFEYIPLFQLIGTTYGGDGESTFALPDLRGRLPLHQGSGFVLGEKGGAEQVTLTTQQIPAHSHPLLASSVVASQSTCPRGVSTRTRARKRR